MDFAARAHTKKAINWDHPKWALPSPIMQIDTDQNHQRKMEVGSIGPSRATWAHHVFLWAQPSRFKHCNMDSKMSWTVLHNRFQEVWALVRPNSPNPQIF